MWQRCSDTCGDGTIKVTDPSTELDQALQTSEQPDHPADQSEDDDHHDQADQAEEHDR